MIDRALTLFAVALLALHVSSARSQSAAKGADITAGANREYYKCIDPKTCTCWAFSEDDKRRCSACTAWQTKTINEYLVGVLQSLDTSGYKNAGGTFVFEAHTSLYGKPSARFSVQALYDNPNHFGFRVLPSDSSRAGAFIVYPTFAGLVLNDKNDVVYPSAALGGRLKIDEASHLSKEPAKVLVPAAAANIRP